MKKFVLIGAFALLASLLAGCGIKGDLYLPGQSTAPAHFQPAAGDSN